MPRPDAGLEVALEQRQRAFEQTQQVLAYRERTLAEHAQLLLASQARVQMMLSQIDAAHQPIAGAALPVGLLSDLERMLRWCEEQLVHQEERLEAARLEVDEARELVARAHQQVKALELVLAARKAERGERVRRGE